MSNLSVLGSAPGKSRANKLGKTASNCSTVIPSARATSSASATPGGVLLARRFLRGLRTRAIAALQLSDLLPVGMRYVEQFSPPLFQISHAIRWTERAIGPVSIASHKSAIALA